MLLNVDEIETTLSCIAVEEMDGDIARLCRLGIELEEIHQTCQDGLWDSPAVLITVEHINGQLGLPVEPSLENSVLDTIDRIIEAIKEAFVRTYEAVVKWVKVVFDRLTKIINRLKQHEKNAEIKEVDDPVEVELGEHAKALEVGGEIDFDVIVTRLNTIVEPLEKIRNMGTKIVGRFNSAKTIKDVDVVTNLSNGLIDYINKHFNTVEKDLLYSSKDLFPGNKRLIIDLTSPVPVLKFEEESVKNSSTTKIFTIESLQSAIDKLNIDEVSDLIKNTETFSKEIVGSMKSGFKLARGNREVITELMKIATPINGMLQSMPRNLISYYTQTLGHLETSLKLVTDRAAKK
mgnify:CR=1 FL=1